MQDDEFDEFGNYIGNEPLNALVNTSSIENQEELLDRRINYDENPLPIVLHEDKKYYPSSSQIFGNQVECIVQEEDIQPLSEPTIKFPKEHKYSLNVKAPSKFDAKFFELLDPILERKRNLVVMGGLHHGKTMFIDMLMKYIYENELNIDKFTDSLLLERARRISLQSKPISLILQDSRKTSKLMNLFDTPGHLDYSIERKICLDAVDGVFLIVDIVEGITLGVHECLFDAMNNGLSIILIINKIDRLIVELKLPPSDSYFKIKVLIDELNGLLHENYCKFNPTFGNVLFASTLYGWIFTIESFIEASEYNHHYQNQERMKSEKSLKRIEEELCSNVKPLLLEKLWGDYYYNGNDRTICNKNTSNGLLKRTFVTLILEPLYKLHSYALGENISSLISFLKSTNLKRFQGDRGRILSEKFNKLLSSDGRKSLLQAVMQVFIPIEKVINLIIDSAFEFIKIPLIISDFNDFSLIAKIIKYFPEDYSETVTEDNKVDSERVYKALIKIYSGVLSLGQKVKLTTIDENFEILSSTELTIKNIDIYCTRFSISVDRVHSGSWATITLNKSIFSCSPNSCVLVTCDVDPSNIPYMNNDKEKQEKIISFLRCLEKKQKAKMNKALNAKSLIKVGIEPLNPSELPKLLEGFENLNRELYPAAQIKMEDTGEYIIFGPGEMYLDCVLHDLRNRFAKMEIKISNPFVKLSETISETSFVKCYAYTPNKKNKISMIAEPMSKEFVRFLESGMLSDSNSSLSSPSDEIVLLLREKFGWNLLATRSILAIGPHEKYGPNILLNDILPTHEAYEQINLIKDALIQGFLWAVREGPITEEPMRNCIFRIIDISINENPLLRTHGQLVPTCRRVCFSAFLSATPRLLEPIYFVEIHAPIDCVKIVYELLSKRRGHVIMDNPKPGSPLYVIHALIPYLDSFGFEIDLRIHTHGSVFVECKFDSWQMVPGDPLNSNIIVPVLEAASAFDLARDLTIKTRRRKGLGEDVTVEKFFDEGMISELARQTMQVQ